MLSKTTSSCIEKQSSRLLAALQNSSTLFWVVEEPYTQALIWNHLLKHERGLAPLGRCLLPQDLDLPGWDENLNNLSLFGPELYLILQGEKLDKATVQKLLALKSAHQIIIKASQLSAALKTVPSTQLIHLPLPTPWQRKSSLDLYAEEMELPLGSQELEKLLVTLQGHELSEAFFILNRLKIALSATSDKKMKEEIIGEFRKMHHEFKGHFELCYLFIRREFTTFFGQLTLLPDASVGELIGPLNFLMNGLIKMITLKEGVLSTGKERSGRWERELQNASQRWKLEELRHSLKFLGELETKIKERKLGWRHELQTLTLAKL